jgi:hypothetical protein
MLPEIDQYVELLDQRLLALRQLARQFIDCRPAFVAMDLDGIYGHVAEQEELCRRIRSIDAALRAAAEIRRKRLADPAQAAAVREAPRLASATRLGQLKRELDEAQAEVRQLNGVHAAMLRRSGRTLAMLMNFFGCYAMTYAPPVACAIATPFGEGRR